MTSSCGYYLGQKGIGLSTLVHVGGDSVLGLRIPDVALMFESDPDTRDRLRAAMTEAGHGVLVASTLREAFLRLTEGGIDAVVIDAYDPRAGVVELARSMNSLPDAPPIVLVSSSPHAPEISARIGAAAFVPVPFELQELLAIVARLTGDLRPVREFEDEDPTGPVRQTG